MVNNAGERSFINGILIKKSTHANNIISITFQEEAKLIEFTGLTASILYDFYIKALGASNLTENRLASMPLGINKRYFAELAVRVLRLNALNTHYKDLWEKNWIEEFKSIVWGKEDLRLSEFNRLTRGWKWETPLRNWFERRQALVEIDVITAMALDLTLEELILIYNVQFPVLQQNEDDTWYDTKGNIVFTCSKGLTGVGLDRPVWDTIKDMKAGEIYPHIIEKSELYKGKEVKYYAPFDKCDRVEDYKTAWAHFDQLFKEN